MFLYLLYVGGIEFDNQAITSWRSFGFLEIYLDIFSKVTAYLYCHNMGNRI